MSLTQHIKQAKSGTADSLVIFLHGYGADGKDLLGLADPLAEHMPNTLFISPDAPTPCSVNPMGYEWFPIPRLDGSSTEAMELGMANAVTQLNGFLDDVAAEKGIGPERTVLVGFSQGTMMSLHVAPRRDVGFAGLVGFSGALMYPEKLALDIKQKLPVMLIHGDADDMVPYGEMGKAADALAHAEFEIYTHTSPDTAHGIAPDGLGQALHFMQKVL